MKFGFEKMIGQGKSKEGSVPPQIEGKPKSTLRPYADYQVPDDRGHLPKNPDGSMRVVVDRSKYRFDLFQTMVSRGIPMETALGEFFRDNRLTKREMGMFAMEATRDGGLVLGAIILARALARDPSFIREELFTEYIPISPQDMHMLAVTWEVDSALGWPAGTSAPASRKHLERWVGSR